MKLKIRDKKGNIIPSRPARGAWIEMAASAARDDAVNVAPRKGRVD